MNAAEVVKLLEAGGTVDLTGQTITEPVDYRPTTPGGHVVGGTFTALFRLRSADGWRLDGLTFTDGGWWSMAGGTGWVANRVTVTGAVGMAGFQLCGDTDPNGKCLPPTHFAVNDCTFTDQVRDPAIPPEQHHLVYVQTTDAAAGMEMTGGTFNRCEFRNCPGGLLKCGGASTYQGACRGVTFTDCTFGTTGDAPLVLLAGYAQGLTFTRCGVLPNNATRTAVYSNGPTAARFTDCTFPGMTATATVARQWVTFLWWGFWSPVYSPYSNWATKPVGQPLEGIRWA